MSALQALFDTMDVRVRDDYHIVIELLMQRCDCDYEIGFVEEEEGPRYNHNINLYKEITERLQCLWAIKYSVNNICKAAPLWLCPVTNQFKEAKTPAGCDTCFIDWIPVDRWEGKGSDLNKMIWDPLQ